MKKKIIAIVIISVMALMTVVPAYAGEVAETIQVLYLDGVWRDGTISSGQRSQIYQVNIPSDGYLQLKLRSYHSTLHVEMLDAETQEEWFYDAIMHGTSNSPVAKGYTIPVNPGTYKIKLLTDANNQTDHRYAVSASFTSVTANDKAAISYDSPCNYTLGTTVNGFLTKTDNTKWFRFNIPEYGLYKMAWSTKNPDNSVAGAYGRFSYTIYSSDLIESFEPNEGHGDDWALNKGIYYLKIKSNQAVISGGTYQFSIVRAYEKLDAYSVKLPKDHYAYTGKSIKPKPKVENLKEGIDYTLSYKNNKAMGKATVIVKGIGIYCGTVRKTFYIGPKPTKLISIKSNKSGTVTVKWKKQNKKTSGYQIQFSVWPDFNHVNKKITIKNNKITKKVVSFNYPVNYYVRIRTYKKDGKKIYYSAWSKSMYLALDRRR